METKIAPAYLRDLALMVGNQAVTAEEMREIARALRLAADALELAESDHWRNQ